MMNFKYEVNTYMDNEEVTFRTNNPHNAITAFCDALEMGAHVNIVDGTTGEVLAIANCPDMDDYATEEIALMMLGWLMAQHWGEPVADPIPESHPEVKCLPGFCPDPHELDPAGAILSALFGEVIPLLPAGEDLPS